MRRQFEGGDNNAETWLTIRTRRLFEGGDNNGETWKVAVYYKNAATIQGIMISDRFAVPVGIPTQCRSARRGPSKATAGSDGWEENSWDYDI